MISLAAGGTELVFFLIMVAFGLINWLLGKMKSAGKPPDASAPSGREVGRPIPPQQSEDERMRKFLEALGIPSDAPAPQRPAPPVALPPQPRPLVQRPKRAVPAPPAAAAAPRAAVAR